MLRDGKIVLDSGFIYDYKTMMGEGRITENDLLEIQSRVEVSSVAINKMRYLGAVKGCFSKLPYMAEGNPNDPDSIERLISFSEYVKSKVDAVVFWGLVVPT